MADVKSLGRHRPSALDYLVAEGVLPKDPSEDAYDWIISSDGDSEDELLSTKTCVVWSRHGVRQRVFNFSVEGQEVKQALLTHFVESVYSREEPRVDAFEGHRALNTSKGNTATADSATRKQSGELQRALVVLLRGQAHIYFLCGASYTINLSIEIEQAWPLPIGLLLQRKTSTSSMPPPTPIPPSAPHNSFFSSQNAHYSSPGPNKNRDSHRHTAARTSTGFSAVTAKSLTDGQPRLFVLKDPAAGLGMVLRPSKSSFASSISPPLVAVSQDEEVLYVSSSTKGELRRETMQAPIVIVTVNKSINVYNVWQALDMQPDSSPTSDQRPKKRVSSYKRNTRRSSYNTAFNSGATTPVHIQQGVASQHHGKEDRRSLAGFAGRTSRLSESTLLDQDEKALFPEIQHRKGAGRSSSFRGDRRTTSLMARSELSSQDPGNLPDVTRNPLGATSSFTGAGGLSGQSFGVANDRISFGKPRTSGRYSMPGDTSMLSDVEEGNSLENDIDDIFMASQLAADGAGHLDPFDSLQRQTILVNAFHIPFTDHAETQGLPAPTSPWNIVMQGPLYLSKSSGNVQDMSLFFLQVRSRILYEVRMSVRLGQRTGRKDSMGGLPETNEQSMLRHEHETKLRHNGIVDIIKITDGPSEAIVVLQQANASETIMLRLSNDKIDRSHSRIQRLQPGDIQLSLPSSVWSSEARTILSTIAKPDPSTESFLGRFPLVALANAGLNGQFDLKDSQSMLHRCCIGLRSRNSRVLRVLDLCRFHVAEVSCVDLECSWWYIRNRFLGGKDDHDWTALTVLILALIISLADRPAKISKGIQSPETSFQAMKDGCRARTAPSHWDWVRCHPTATKRVSNGFEEVDTEMSDELDQLLTACVRVAYTITSAGHDDSAEDESSIRSTRDETSSKAKISVLQHLVLGLHQIHEEQALSAASARDEPELPSVLAQVARWVGAPSLEQHYGGVRSKGDLEELTSIELVRLDLPNPIKLNELDDEDMRAARTWLDSFGTYRNHPSKLLRPSTSHKTYHGSLTVADSGRLPYNEFLNLVLSIGKHGTRTQSQVETIFNLGIKPDAIELMPESLASSSRDALCRIQRSPPVAWPPGLLDVADRDDLKLFLSGSPDGVDSTYHTAEHIKHLRRGMQSICRTEDHHTVPSTRRIDHSDSLLRHVYRDDKRWYEASKLVDPVRVASTVIQPEAAMTEAEFLDSQKEKAQLVYQRTMALPSGQAIMRFGNVKPIMTEKLKISTFNTTCNMQPSNNSVNADKSNFTEEKVGWAFFHAGVNAGLQISPDAPGIDTSWIVLNKPSELGNRHAGLLLALGLNGHLRKMAKWLSFKYLTNKHSMTSVGLLLGLSASHLGTMDSLVTRLLSVHISKLLPIGAAELNLSPVTQTAGVVGVGLLYYDSQHRRMSEVMLSEIEHVEAEDSESGCTDHRDEAYRLAAGFALGLINLGKGANLRALHDLDVVERLLAVATGPREIDNVHVLDRASAGATFAIAMIFMKTHDRAIAKQIDVPSSIQQFDTIRPDILMLRTVAKWLILWDDITPSVQWVKENSPKEWLALHELPCTSSVKNSDNIPFFNIVAGLCWAIALKHAGTDSEAALSVLTHYHNIVRKMMQTRHGAEGATFDEQLATETLIRWENHLQLSLATVAAGSGKLTILRKLRLHQAELSGKSFGQHQATAMAIGLLFMGHGRYTLGTSNLAVAAMLIAFYPLLPNDVLDNRAHLQALRHFWVFAAEARCIIPRDVETREVLEVSVQIYLRAYSGSKTDQTNSQTQPVPPEIKTAPILLPDLDTISRVEIASPHHWPVTLDFENNLAHLTAFRRHQTVFLKRKPLLSQVKGSFGVALAQTMATHGSDLNVRHETAKESDFGADKSALQWIFDLPAFREVGVDGVAAEIVPLRMKKTDAIGTLLSARTTAVDDVMVLAADVDSEDAWKLQLLRTFLEREEHLKHEIVDSDLGPEEQKLRETKWLRSEWVQGLRAKVARRVERVLTEMNAKRQKEEQGREDDMVID